MLLPFGTDQNVENTLLLIIAPFIGAGACSNLFSHVTKGTKNAVYSTKKVVSEVGSGIKYLCSAACSMFARCRQTPQNSDSAKEMINDLAEEKLSVYVEAKK